MTESFLELRRSLQSLAGSHLDFFRRLEESLLSVERKIGLLEVFRPVNGLEVLPRWEKALKEGTPLSPLELRYRQKPGLEREQIILSTARSALASFEHPFVSLFSSRVLELERELELVAARGSDRVREQSRRRYFVDAPWAERARELSFRWLELPVDDSSEASVLLAAELTKLARQDGLDVPVVPRNMPTRAAVTATEILVQQGARTSAAEARRIYLHEVHGHLLPRQRARRLGPPFRIGAARGNATEEGRALLLEERAGLLSSKRKRELAARHQICARTLAGEEPATIGAALVKGGLPISLVASSLLRASRGGGLCREIIYLPALLEVKETFACSPELESWLELGPLSLSAAAELESLLS